MGALEGRAIVVTGAGRGLGRAYAQAAAVEGARVVVNDIDGEPLADLAQELREAGTSVLEHVGSVADWDEAQRLVEMCVDGFGAIDGLVNNAGLFRYADPVDESEQDLRRIVESNVLGPMFCGTHALRAMYRQHGGTIINATSGSHVGMKGMSTYGATKGALASLTYGWAIEAEPHGVRVNAISPLAQSRMGDGVGVEFTYNQQPPEKVAPAVTYLLSDRVFFNGQVVRFDGATLSLLRPPGYREEAVTRDRWSSSDIGEALERDLADGVASIGMTTPPVAATPDR